jgi:hypothetical protein
MSVCDDDVKHAVADVVNRDNDDDDKADPGPEIRISSSARLLLHERHAHTGKGLAECQKSAEDTELTHLVPADPVREELPHGKSTLLLVSDIRTQSTDPESPARSVSSKSSQTITRMPM